MPIDRPTFSEVWYRVADLKPRLRGLVQVYRQHYRGQLWYVLRDPGNNQFFRLDDAGYTFIGLLDGKRTVAQAWEISNEQLGDRAPTQGEAIQLLGQLYSSNLVHAEVPADARGLFERYRKRMRREIGGYFMNLLFARIPLFDPDRLLDVLVKPFGWLFGPVGVALWLLIMAAGAWVLAGHFGELLNQGYYTYANLNAERVVWLYVAFAVLKVFHEFGHGVACKYFGRRQRGGGEVHTMGIMLLVLTPVPYVDATSAWAFRNKWHRAFVGAAGMYVELAIAVGALFVWANTSAQGAYPLVNTLAYNMIFIASVSTLLFNLNPLLRFDGYYILSDLLELPNLNQRSKEYVYYLVKKYAYGVRRPRDPARSNSERAWLLVFAVLSTVYRVIISIGIFFFVANKLFFIGMLLAISGIIAWVGMPMYKFFKYLVSNPELSRTRRRAGLVTAVFLGLVFVGVGLIPVPDRDRAMGIAAPRDRRNIVAGSDGFVRSIAASNQRVNASAQLADAVNVELQLELQRLAAKRNVLEARYKQQRSEDLAAAQIVRNEINVLERDMAEIERKLAGLRVDAPFPGLWVSKQVDELEGMYVRRGEPLGDLLDADEVIVKVAAGQTVGPRVVRELGVGSEVELRLPGLPDAVYHYRIDQILTDQQQLPSPALSVVAGGDVAVQPDDQQGTKSIERFFLLRLIETERSVGRDATMAQPRLQPGQRVVARFDFGKRPIAVQAWQALRRMAQRRLGV